MLGWLFFIDMLRETVVDLWPPGRFDLSVPVMMRTLKLLRSDNVILRCLVSNSYRGALDQGLQEPSLDAPLRVGKQNWNQQAVDAAWQPPSYTPERASAVYAASKIEGERALWRFMEAQRPYIVANAVLPNVDFGRVLSSPGVTGNAVPQVLHGQIPTNIGPRESRAI